MAQSPAAKLPSILIRTAILAGLWWLIVQGRADSWLIGLPAVALASFASVWLGNQALPRLTLTRLPGFLGLFLRESVRGGVDVARRTLGPTLRIKPGFVRYRLHISHPTARVLLINCIGLLPGTLAADLDGDHADLHLLDISTNQDPQLLRLEAAIARLFGLTLEKNDA
ncbi:MAG: Na+/H+ antiporter subunit E [Gammaproteobacteria bacterium]